MANPLNSQRWCYYLIDLGFFLLCSYAPYYLYYQLGKPESWKYCPLLGEYSLFFLFQLILLGLVFSQRKLYNTIRNWGYLNDIMNVCGGLLVVALLSTIMIFLNRMDYFARSIFLVEFLLLAVALSGWRLFKRYWLRRMIAKGFRNLNLLLIGSDAIGAMVGRYYRENRCLGAVPIGYLAEQPAAEMEGLSYLGTYDELDKVCNSHFIDEAIVLSNVPSELGCRMINRLVERGMSVGMFPVMAENLPPVFALETINEVTMFRFGDQTLTPLNSLLKRGADIVLSAAALVLLSPVFLLLALLVKWSSPGPVFFRQKRVGVKGKEFDFYKFRSMVVNAEALRTQLEQYNEVKDGVIFKMKNDPRITPIGHFLRKYSLDELPQLFNVLKGDMSIVGPRPPLMSEVLQYQHEQMGRLMVRPGLTGLPQIRGRSDLAFNEWVKWDLWYIRNWSLWLDLRIILATIPVVLKGKGAY